MSTIEGGQTTLRVSSRPFFFYIAIGVKPTRTTYRRMRCGVGWVVLDSPKHRRDSVIFGCHADPNG